MVLRAMVSITQKCVLGAVDRCCARQTGHPLLSGEGDNTALVTESSGDLTPYRVRYRGL